VEEKGYDLSNHRSRPVTSDLVNQFHLILTMEKNQKEALQIAFPSCEHRIYMLSEMINQIFDIADPFGGRKPDYEWTVRELEEILTKGFKRILDLTQENSES
jgi:protein-tyrosine-phosphatase